MSELFGRPVYLVSKRSLHAAIREDLLVEARQLHAGDPLPLDEILQAATDVVVLTSVGPLAP